MILLNFVSTLIMVVSMTLTPSNTINGYIVDNNTNETLVGVKITVNDSISTYTNLDGYFEINNISDTINMKIEYISYETIDIKVSGDEYKNNIKKLQNNLVD
jgi:phosphatidate phosphatase APP1